MRKRHKNFMMIPNKFWEAMYLKPLQVNEGRVFDYIYRKTLGWGVRFKYISTYEISKELGMRDSTVRANKRALIKKRRILKNGDEVGIQEDYTLWLVGKEIPTKEVGKSSNINRSTDVHLVGEEKPLIKETLKDRKTGKGLSPSQRKKKRKEYKTGLAMMKEAVERSQERKRKNK
ncbi:unnamed protein product [marine sediment metagenome]|uniref:Bacteriophage lambda Replication protein O N-terminal domain-containing protein n=1 Tax=marine sediment metagenome TaxID=412755 RepID=X1JC96_9ZZZZ